MENNLILKAYRKEDDKNTINIDLKAHTYGFEIYRICLMLLDKLISLSGEDNELKDVEGFFEKMKEDYKQFYKR